MFSASRRASISTQRCFTQLSSYYLNSSKAAFNFSSPLTCSCRVATCCDKWSLLTWRSENNARIFSNSWLSFALLSSVASSCPPQPSTVLTCSLSHALWLRFFCPGEPLEQQTSSPALLLVRTSVVAATPSPPVGPVYIVLPQEIVVMQVAQLQKITWRGNMVHQILASLQGVKHATIGYTLLRSMEDPAAATDSSGVPSIIERSPLDFANEAGAADQGTMAPEVPPLKDVLTTRGASEAGQAEGVTATDPSAVIESHKRGHDGVDANAPPKVLRKDHADPRPTRSTRGGKSLAAIELGMASTRHVLVRESTPADVNDPDPLSFADPRSRHLADIAQSS
nr:hypothetical protein [Tanacetum cinerariifolium]